MQVSVETTQGLQRRMTVQVPSDRVEKEVEKRLRNLGGRVRLDGFRPGKVPFKVLQQRFGEQVRGEVLGEVLQSSYADALGQQKLRPAGVPEIEPKQMEPGKDLEFVATFEVLPEFELKGAEGLKIERPLVEIGDAEIDDVIEKLRNQQAEFKDVARKAKKTDKVVIDFKGLIDDKPFVGNEGEDVPVTIGSGEMPPEFEKGLVGVKTGEQKQIEYAFPDNFPDTAVAGKTAVFDVTVKNVQAPELPEVDDAFAEKLGVKEGGVTALRERVKENLERERDQAVRAQVKRRVMDGLADANQFELPAVLVDAEIKHLRSQAEARLRQVGQQPGEDELPASMFEDEARRRVTLGLVVNEIIRANNLKLDPARVRTTLQEMAAGYDQPQQVIQYYTQNRKLMEGIEVAALEDQVVDWVLEKAKVTEKKTSLKALTTGEATADSEG
jgi:trigger factor